MDNIKVKIDLDLEQYQILNKIAQQNNLSSTGYIKKIITEELRKNGARSNLQIKRFRNKNINAS